MITPDKKDIILKEIATSGINIQFEMKQLARDFNISFDEVEAIIDHFEELGFIEANRMIGGMVIANVKVRCHDFYSHGGFTAQEELLRKNIEKLLLEIESLKPSIPDKIEKITSIISGISSALSLFVPK
jgi:hypothetical protein